MVPTATEKRCKGCKQHKPLDDFYRLRSGRHGRQDRCKECQSSPTAQARKRERMARRRQRADYEAKRKVWARTSHLRRYGLTEADFDAMLDRQDAACAGCRSDFTEDNGPKIDHDHDTGEVRGLLCNGCNVALGMLGDDAVRIAGLLVYLQSRA